MRAALLLASLLPLGAAAAGASRPLVLRHRFVQADVARLPLCLARHCRLVDSHTTADKFTGGTRRTVFQYEVTPAPSPLRQVQFSVFVDARQLIQGLSLDLLMPDDTPPSVYRSAVLAWGQSAGLTVTNLAPCLATDWRSSPRAKQFAGLGRTLDGGCSALGGTRIDARYFLAVPIDFPK